MKWVVVWFETEGVHDAAIVCADSEEQAAESGMEWLQNDEDEKGGRETVENVFVLPWDGRTVYTRRIAVEKSEMQCCGGPAPDFVDCGGHYATCRLAECRERESR